MEDMPSEIILNILSYLPIHDVYNYCEAVGDHSYLCDNNILKHLHVDELCGKTAFKFYTLLDSAPSNSYLAIESLHLKNASHLSGDELRMTIAKMKRLNCLEALNTQLSVEYLDLELYKVLPLEKLSITIYNPNLLRNVTDKIFKNLRHFEIVIKTENMLPCDIDEALFHFLCCTPLIEALQVQFDSQLGYRINFVRIVNKMKNLHTLSIIWQGDCVKTNGIERLGFLKTHENITGINNHQLFCKKKCTLQIPNVGIPDLK